jgi:hypothetical protein
MKVFFIPDSFQGHFLRWGCSLMEKTMKGYFVFSFSFSFFFFATVIATAAEHQMGLTAPRVVDVKNDGDHLSLGKKFPCVLKLCGINDLGGRFFLGGGVLVHPQWVLTVLDGNAVVDFEYLEVEYFDLKDLSEESPKSVTCHRAPVFLSGHQGPALIKLDQEIRGIRPARWGLDVSIEAGIEVLKVGFGGTSGRQSITFDGRKRGGYAILTEVIEGRLIADFITDKNHPHFLELGILGSKFDLGGGWFLERDGEYFLCALWVGPEEGLLVTQEWISSVVGPPPASLQSEAGAAGSRRESLLYDYTAVILLAIMLVGAAFICRVQLKKLGSVVGL